MLDSPKNTRLIKPNCNAAYTWYYPNHEDTYFRMPQMAMRKNNYSLIGWLPEKTDSLDLEKWMATNGPWKFELYDLSKDLSQAHNIAGKYPEVVHAMRHEMTYLWREMRDEGLSE